MLPTGPKLGDSFLFRLIKKKSRLDLQVLHWTIFYGPTPFFDLDDVEPTVIPEADCVDANGKLILANSLTDVLISADILLPQGEYEQLAKVLRQSVDQDG